MLPPSVSCLVLFVSFKPKEIVQQKSTEEQAEYTAKTLRVMVLCVNGAETLKTGGSMFMMKGDKDASSVATKVQRVSRSFCSTLTPCITFLFDLLIRYVVHRAAPSYSVMDISQYLPPDHGNSFCLVVKMLDSGHKDPRFKSTHCQSGDPDVIHATPIRPTTRWQHHK
ncbi:hypothetical protein AVEN_82549-1 [Araneus ventricosus]|uniref:Uncharacterized protein n=1 Tax=Araneus ventricosus TaxID=182803 RepID=A0A4Y2VWW8_ARAVE|nr:hypothetical protein AVEN_82549-1 [Araneus ventricosus]